MNIYLILHNIHILNEIDKKNWEHSPFRTIRIKKYMENLTTAQILNEQNKIV